MNAKLKIVKTASAISISNEAIQIMFKRDWGGGGGAKGLWYARSAKFDLTILRLRKLTMTQAMQGLAKQCQGYTGRSKAILACLNDFWA